MFSAVSRATTKIDEMVDFYTNGVREQVKIQSYRGELGPLFRKGDYRWGMEAVVRLDDVGAGPVAGHGAGAHGAWDTRTGHGASRRMPSTSARSPHPVPGPD